MLKIISHEGNAKQKQNDTPLLTPWDGYTQKSGKEGLARMWRKQNTCILLVQSLPQEV